VLRFLADLAVIQFFNYVLARERTGVYSPSVLPLSLATTCIFAVLWRLSFFESLYFNRHYRIFCDAKSKAGIQKDFNGFPGQFDFFEIQNLKKELKQGPFVYVVQDTALSEPDFMFLMQEKMHGVNVYSVTQFYEKVLRKIPIELVSIKDLIFESGFELTSRMFLQRLKRVSDLILAISLLILTWPLILFFGIIHKLESEGPMIYSQLRTGKHGEVFTIYKLRSMRTDAEVNGAVWAQVDDNRVTKIGKFMRLTRIDELPQLWNVIRGDMSFIGPRPERPEFNVSLSEQIQFYDLRHSVRPGLTGWAQVLYPYGASVEDAREKLRCDLFYVKNYTLLLDFEILIKTVQVVLFGKGR
ncbi:MAG: exopolysaccharide biosynthesis polyprenyl glycosylphosphotransferase, partial [Pseudobdellovibrio sp.]